VLAQLLDHYPAKPGRESQADLLKKLEWNYSVGNLPYLLLSPCLRLTSSDVLKGSVSASSIRVFGKRITFEFHRVVHRALRNNITASISISWLENAALLYFAVVQQFLV
jgi:hypothetical protein